MARLKSSAELRVTDELKILRFLCASNSDSRARKEILQSLATYAWSSNDHALFFECIRDLFAGDPNHILANLPTALTRRGFPDMPVETLAAPPKLSSASALALADSLIHPNK